MPFDNNDFYTGMSEQEIIDHHIHAFLDHIVLGVSKLETGAAAPAAMWLLERRDPERYGAAKPMEELWEDYLRPMQVEDDASPAVLDCLAAAWLIDRYYPGRSHSDWGMPDHDEPEPKPLMSDCPPVRFEF